ncbi:MAG: hypothetical protein FWH08_00885 [Oscillospiraceae bacterium]|nr:hypothetical protein [Oscillospiraceae bacterium]
MKRVILLMLFILLLLTMVACAKTPPAIDENSNIEINSNLLDDLDLTYSELTEKHGELLQVGGIGAGFWYAFENGYGHYFWSGDTGAGSQIEWNGHQVLMDENGDIILESAPKPKQGEICLFIDKIPIDKMFIGLTLPTDVSGIEEAYLIAHIGSSWNGHDDVFNSSFSYKNGIITISTSNAKEGIDVDYISGVINDETLLIFDKESTVSIRIRYES